MNNNFSIIDDLLFEEIREQYRKGEIEILKIPALEIYPSYEKYVTSLGITEEVVDLIQFYLGDEYSMLDIQKGKDFFGYDVLVKAQKIIKVKRVPKTDDLELLDLSSYGKRSKKRKGR